MTDERESLTRRERIDPKLKAADWQSAKFTSEAKAQAARTESGQL
jgi:hypothetical protein